MQISAHLQKRATVGLGYARALLLVRMHNRGQLDRERGPPIRIAAEADVAALRQQDLLGSREAEARPDCLGGVVGKKDFLLLCGRNALATIGNRGQHASSS